MAPMHADEKVIVFVLYPGLTPLDLVGPLQVFASLRRLDPRFRPVVVGERMVPMPSDIEVAMIPDATFADVPRPDIIVVPGGVGGTLRATTNEAVRAYVRSAAETAEIVASVCTGSLILASVGLLGERPATTHWVAAGILDNYGATYTRQRWVEDGKLIMAAGVSAGIDMALQLVARLTDEETARRVQLDLEYDPQPPFGGIDWNDVGRMPGLFTRLTTLLAPILTRRAKRMTNRAGWRPLPVTSPAR